jgi:prephenate dehydratase
VLSTVHFGVVPQENSIFGSVIETYDNLRKPGSGLIRGDVILEVQHCLLVQKGAKIHQISKVLSHEQVGKVLPKYI